MSHLFTWHPLKADRNIDKHGVAFTEAQTVFNDPLAVIFPDEDHSEEEMQEIIIGKSAQERFLIVSFTERDEAIRIISVRRATAKERRDHEAGTNF